MSFDAVRELTPEEADTVIDNVQKIATSIASEKAYFASLEANRSSMTNAVEELNTPLVEGKGVDPAEF